ALDIPCAELSVRHPTLHLPIKGALNKMCIMSNLRRKAVSESGPLGRYLAIPFPLLPLFIPFVATFQMAGELGGYGLNPMWLRRLTVDTFSRQEYRRAQAGVVPVWLVGFRSGAQRFAGPMRKLPREVKKCPTDILYFF